MYKLYEYIVQADSSVQTVSIIWIDIFYYYFIPIDL